MAEYTFQKVYKLNPHSPLIHFQWQSEFVTLRATEMKPKLDRYILKHCKNIPERWIRNTINEKVSLDYKLRIVANESKPPIELGRNTSYDIFYGNMGDGSKKKGVKNRATITVTCFDKDLLDYIDGIIGDFFIVTNFGTMQNKGFGSFTVVGYDNSDKHIREVLKTEYTNDGHCYSFHPNNEETTFQQIKMVYSLMKSGHNLSRDGQYPKTKMVNGKNYSELYYHHSLLSQYAHIMEVNDRVVNMGNEKSWMKQNDIVPKLGKETQQNDKYSRYVRALLGIGESIRYKNKDSLPAVTVKIEERPKGKTPQEKKANKIERLNSPILFKVINNVVYFVGCEPNKEIYGKKFSFSSSMKRKGMTLDVPKEDELPENFMNRFMEYCFEELNRYFNEIKGYFSALKNNMPQKYNDLKNYEKNFRDTANITISRGDKN